MPATGNGARRCTTIIDAVNWAIAAGIADPARIAIAGGGYGEYATWLG